MKETINFSELKNYHLELFRQIFGAVDGSIDEIFNIVWKGRLRDEVVADILKRESKYFTE